MSEALLRTEIVETARAMSRAGLSPGRSGNVSARWGAGMLITPSGMPYEAIAADDVAYVGRGGEPRPGERAPSSEWRFHLAIYTAKPDVNAVVHCHSIAATALACLRLAVPPFHYMVTAAGGHDVRLAPYATFGTPELADGVVTALDGRLACLMANHGQTACGATLRAALELAETVEALAAQYIAARAIGEPHLLSAEEMDAAVEQFKNYGQPARG
ncbi:MAG: class II aldolase/adducin family protein [Hyphomicrobiales bacterium]|nr:class II aldolase/adducin family protein [Hyphomicrobiales bacterium]